MEPVANRLRGVVEMLAIRPGWRTRFDVSPSGFVRSFLAAVFAAPFFVLSVAGQNAVYARLAEDPELARPAGFVQGFAIYLLMWIYFPVVAHVFTGAFRLRASFTAWVAVHNWTVLFLLLIQAAMGAAVLLGVLTPDGYLELGFVYLLVALYAHSRAAIGALEAPVPVAIGGACCGVLVWLIVQLLLARAFAGAALQA
jgi:hypothetical protein